MKRDVVIVKGNQTFTIYGDRVRGYFLTIWDHSDQESQRIDVALTDLTEALEELGASDITLSA